MLKERNFLYFDLQKGSQSANHSAYCEMQFWIFVWECLFFQNVGLLTTLWSHEGNLIKEEQALFLLPLLATWSFLFSLLSPGGDWVLCPTDHRTPMSSSFLSFSFWLSSLPSSFFNRNISTFISSHYLFTFSVSLNKLMNGKSSWHTQVCGQSCVHITYVLAVSRRWWANDLMSVGHLVACNTLEEQWVHITIAATQLVAQFFPEAQRDRSLWTVIYAIPAYWGEKDLVTAPYSWIL